MTELKWEPKAVCKNCGATRDEHSGDDSMDCLVRFEPVEATKSPNDPTSQSGDETKFYREVEDMIEKNGGTMPERSDELRQALTHIPEPYKGRLSYDYNEKTRMFDITTNGYGVAQSEDSEVAHAICQVFNRLNGTINDDALKTKRIAYAIAQVERLRRELEAAKHNLRIEQGYSQ